LESIEPLIRDEMSIPHNQTKLKNYPSLQTFLQSHYGWWTLLVAI